MATEKITMPQLGESVTEGTISKWLVEVGDVVQKYDPIAEVTTDKVNAEVPSSFTGKIKELTASEGDTLEVGDLIGYIESEAADGAEEDESSAEKAEEKTVETDGLTAEASDAPMKKRYSPAVLKLAQENDIDLDQVNGSGKGGRITRKDIMIIIESGNVPKAEPRAEKKSAQEAPKTAAAAEEKKAAPQSASIPVVPGDVEIPVSGVRRAIATNMVRSKHEAPHAWTMVEVDVTNLVNYRNSVKNDFKSKEGYSLTFLPFFIKATVEALKEFPRINSMWAGDKIIEKKDINISIAVATDDALYVPVIKNADEKSIKGLGKSVNDLAKKVRENRLSGDDMQGGTFTVNNTGSFGSIQSQPIINYPQAAILSVESIVKRPVVMNNGMIAVRDMVNLCMSLDHRVLDGLIVGRFLASVKDKLEKITPENTSIY
ncbi:2-oxoisovalerate dehydrogenase E2 component (dihydrolipoyl transacylase) [Scopulibacillus darangshiensis]|uniref:Dihydrolipoamide acetyltransferase component of pyruvate dehydrogenase complex n=1 Tax=Scopulibacillus darangshiensis TaxID=442528 RepID=A0A4R2PCK5_9BACL|nr:dihydrolipoamide acetyltransferase family protein [Scopulibacillus darangshiensis]TCP31811.1 2-oxoisovalerate dehydrogenase E2 component (dihydrolipoyl transacylase) [Scopulibacillus darangshiensis]